MKHLTWMVWCIVLFGLQIGQGQVKFGVDLYSRYIWRGLDYGNSPSIQPGLSYPVGGFTAGTWGAYSTGPASLDSAGIATVFAEHDLYASYVLTTSSGSFSFLYTDYYYPSSGLKFFDFAANGGSHVLEAGVGYTGPEQLPITVNLYYNFHNDPDKSIYAQIGYPFTTEAGTVMVSAAVTPGKSVWYGTTKGDLISATVTFTRTLKVTESFTLPLMVSYQINPHAERSYLIVGISL